MKAKMNPKKKYANGTNNKGVGPNNYIQTPNEALNDYNIMLAETEKQVANNSLVPIVSMVGGLIQQGIGMAGNFAGQSGIKPGSKEALDKVLDVDPNKIMLTGVNGTVAANGMNNVQKDVEVENKEMYETPQGQVGQFEGATHENNGIPLEVTQDPNANPEKGKVPEGTKIYSNRLKVGDKTLAERKEARERQTANLEKIASQPLVDTAVKNATKRRMMAIQKEESADLQFQEQVNNIQQMADTMVKAFGTGMAGLQDNPVGDTMEYGYGSSSRGVMKYYNGTPPTGINYGQGYNADMFKDFYAKYNELNPGGVMDMKYIQSDLGIDPKTEGFGKVFGPGTYKASQDWLTANKDKMPDGYATENVNAAGIKDSFDATGLVKPFVEPTGVLAGMEKYYQDGVAKKKADDLLANPPGTRFSRAMGKIGEKLGTANEAGMIPGVGDLTKMFGNYLGMNAGIKTANEQRSTDITHTNVFANAGKDSQRMLDNAKQGIETSKAQAIVKATDVGRGGKKGARNSARGVNQMRGMDWLYDTALQGQIAEISANAAQQLSGIDVQKSGVAMNADQLKGQGQYQADMANEAAKDAYYTALGLGRKDQATGMQQTGKDLNAMRQNEIIKNLMKDYGKWFKADETGISNKNKPK